MGGVLLLWCTACLLFLGRIRDNKLKSEPSLNAPQFFLSNSGRGVDYNLSAFGSIQDQGVRFGCLGLTSLYLRL